MSAPEDHFPTDLTGLPECGRCDVVEIALLSDGRRMS
jgi:hypothetical protein